MIKTLEGFNRSKTVSVKQIYSDPLIKMKKYNEAYTSIGASLDRNGLPVTGLTEDTKEAAKKGSIPRTIPGTRRVMEEELDLAEGTLKPTSPYWLAYTVRVGSEPIEMNLESPHDLLKYLFLHGQTIVADGFKAITSDSRVEYVLFSDEQEAETRVTERKVLKKAYMVSDSLDLETKMNILAVYGIITDATSMNTIEDKIDEKIEEDPKKFLSIVDDDYLVFRSLVTKCLDKGILTMADGGVNHGEVNVGYSKETAAEAIAKDPTLQAVLKAKLSGDMNLIQDALKKSRAESEE